MHPLFDRLAVPILSIKNTGTAMFDRSFRAHFGVSVAVCLQLWLILLESPGCPEKCLPIHLLWTLYFFKTYNTEEVASSRFGCTPKTYRKWIWKFARSIADLELVKIHLDILHIQV
jgi:hypothetical protein